MADIKGGKTLQDALAKISKKVKGPVNLRVGFLEDKTYPDGASVATIAAIDNYGAPSKGIPPRPFFTNAVKSGSAEWAGKLTKLMASTDNDARKSLELLGRVIVGDIIRSIDSTTSPTNSPVTNLLKQRFPTRDGMTFEDVLQAHRDVANGVQAPAGKPLVWTGIMRASVDSEVE